MMLLFKRFLLTTLLSGICLQVQSQVLISLIFGDKLNSEKLEFGLIGGFNSATLSNVADNPDVKYLGGFHLGFFFDIKISETFFINTGVYVKSPLGAKGIEPYPVGDSALNLVLEESQVNRKLSYFHVPILAKYYIPQLSFFLEGGLQVGLRTRAYDEFTVDVLEPEDLTFKLDIRDQYTRLDAGLAGGFGFKLQKKLGMNLGLRYYYGLVDIVKDNPEPNPTRNSAFYLYATLPIGRGKAEARREQQEQNEN